MMEIAERVIVTRTFVGVCHMQVCAVRDATDEEILEVANRDNPSGTQRGWTSVVRREGDGAPVSCGGVAGRVHFLLEC